MELVAVILIASVIAVVALSRFSTSAFDEVKFYDETSAALRYAQNTAVATQRTVCATFTGGTQLTLTYAPTYGVATCLSTDGLAPPGGGSAPYTVTAPSGVTYSGATDFTYDRAGRPSTLVPITITISGRQIVIEPETGYVH